MPTICLADDIFVQVRFSVETKFGTYQDALYFTPDEFDTTTTDEIIAMKKERADKYVETIENAPPPKELTKEEILKTINELEAQKVEIENQKAELLIKSETAEAAVSDGDIIVP